MAAPLSRNTLTLQLVTLAAASCGSSSVVTAFGVPQAFLTKAVVSTTASLVPSSVLLDSSNYYYNTHLIQQQPPLFNTLTVAEDASSLLGGAGEILRNIAFAITAVAFLLAGLTFVMASIIIPAAAKELEKECMELAPELWDEYQAKLEPGQTIDQQPELMQELGAKLQPLLDAKIAEIEERTGEKVVDSPPPFPTFGGGGGPAANTGTGTSEVSSRNKEAIQGLSEMKSQWDDDNDSTVIVDAEVISKKTVTLDSKKE